jgi:hypothetical protein
MKRKNLNCSHNAVCFQHHLERFSQRRMLSTPPDI